MSTRANCVFIQSDKGKWTYKLQRWPFGECPDYDTFGPFELFAQAEAHLSVHHANPGGYRIIRSEAYECPHDVTHALDKFELRYANGATHECARCGRYV